MIKLNCLLFVIVLSYLAVMAMGEEQYPFEKYRIAKIFNGKPVAPVLDTAKAKLFRTGIREAAKEGPDFAGHYTVAEWGCGSDCGEFVIIDAITGKVYVPPKDISFSVAQLDYRLESTLLVTHKLASPEGPLEDDLYNWNGSKFVLVKKNVREATYKWEGSKFVYPPKINEDTPK